MIAVSGHTLRRACVALVVLAVAIGTASPAQGASAARASVVASIHLPAGLTDVRPGLGAMWAMNNDEFSYSTLYRIDPATNQVTETVQLGFPAAFMAFGYGSVWVSDYYASTLVRLSPTGHVQATIPVGLQPQWVHFAFGSVWTSNHHAHSMTRVDPATNRAIATVQVGAKMFRNGPEDFTHDARYLYVESSNLPYLQRVDPRTGRTTNLANTGFNYGGDLLWVRGSDGGILWNQPEVVQTGEILLDSYDIHGAVRATASVASGHTISGLAQLGDLIFYGDNAPGSPASAVLRGVDDRTGTARVAIALAGQVGTLRAGFGDLWDVDWNTGTVRRVHVAP